jgi:hypothetical protein
VSRIVSVCCSASYSIFTSSGTSSESGVLYLSGSDSSRYRILSRASEALEMSSRKKTSGCWYRLFTTMCSILSTCASNANRSAFWGGTSPDALPDSSLVAATNGEMPDDQKEYE